MPRQEGLNKNVLGPDHPFHTDAAGVESPLPVRDHQDAGYSIIWFLVMAFCFWMGYQAASGLNP